jgi:hypothetical protein
MLGGPGADAKRVMLSLPVCATCRGARSRGENLNDPKILVMVVVVADSRLIILMPLSRARVRRLCPVGLR